MHALCSQRSSASEAGNEVLNSHWLEWNNVPSRIYSKVIFKDTNFIIIMMRSKLGKIMIMPKEIEESCFKFDGVPSR